MELASLNEAEVNQIQDLYERLQDKSIPAAVVGEANELLK